MQLFSVSELDIFMHTCILMLGVSVLQSLWLTLEETGCCKLTAYTTYISRFLIRKVERFTHQRSVHLMPIGSCALKVHLNVVLCR